MKQVDDYFLNMLSTPTGLRVVQVAASVDKRAASSENILDIVDKFVCSKRRSNKFKYVFTHKKHQVLFEQFCIAWKKHKKLKEKSEPTKNNKQMPINLREPLGDDEWLEKITLRLSGDEGKQLADFLKSKTTKERADWIMSAWKREQKR